MFQKLETFIASSEQVLEVCRFMMRCNIKKGSSYHDVLAIDHEDT
jgi:hypothetical protein